jgi:uncharacterized membrane protein
VETNFKKYIFYYLSIVPIYKGCHKLPERSFFYKKQFPVCSRCTGVAVGQFISYFIGILNYLILNVCINKYNVISFGLLLCIPMFLDWFLQNYFNKISNNRRRFITGFICGIGSGLIYIAILREFFCLIFN